jgi:arginine decarboxylase
MLDPIKLGVICPGMREDGMLADRGIPGDLVSAYLARTGVVPSRTTDHMLLFLFSMGVTKGKWGSLIAALLDFKTDYDRNAPLEHVMPAIVDSSPERYAKLGLRDLGDRMWARMRATRQGYWQAQAYARLPDPRMTPRRAFQALMSGEGELVPLEKMAGRTAAVAVIPYPPGIPIVMPGEDVGPRDGPWLTYLRLLQEWSEEFPGFAKEVEGTAETNGKYHVYCL